MFIIKQNNFTKLYSVQQINKEIYYKSYLRLNQIFQTIVNNVNSSKGTLIENKQSNILKAIVTIVN